MLYFQCDTYDVFPTYYACVVEFQNASVMTDHNVLQIVSLPEIGTKHDYVPDQFDSKSDPEQKAQSQVETAGNSSLSSSIDLSSDLAWITQKIHSQSLPSSAAADIEMQQDSSNNESNEIGKEAKNAPENNVTVVTGSTESTGDSVHKKNADSVSFLHDHHDNGITSATGTEDLLDTGELNSSRNDSTVCETKAHEQSAENGLLSATKRNLVVNDRKSVRSPVETSRSNGSVTTSAFLVADVPTKVRSVTSSERRDINIYPKEARNLHADNKIQSLESRIKMLEGELREAAGIEVSLYSVVAEHGSSMNKVHAPARRLSRLYFHASKQNSKPRRGGAGRSVVSGLVLVAKACGNDVPRYGSS